MVGRILVGPGGRVSVKAGAVVKSQNCSCCEQQPNWAFLIADEIIPAYIDPQTGNGSPVTLQFALPQFTNVANRFGLTDAEFVVELEDYEDQNSVGVTNVSNIAFKPRVRQTAGNTTNGTFFFTTKFIGQSFDAAAEDTRVNFQSHDVASSNASFNHFNFGWVYFRPADDLDSAIQRLIDNNTATGLPLTPCYTDLNPEFTPWDDFGVVGNNPANIDDPNGSPTDWGAFQDFTDIYNLTSGGPGVRCECKRGFQLGVTIPFNNDQRGGRRFARIDESTTTAYTEAQIFIEPHTIGGPIDFRYALNNTYGGAQTAIDGSEIQTKAIFTTPGTRFVRMEQERINLRQIVTRLFIDGGLQDETTYTINNGGGSDRRANDCDMRVTFWGQTSGTDVFADPPEQFVVSISNHRVGHF